MGDREKKIIDIGGMEIGFFREVFDLTVEARPKEDPQDGKLRRHKDLVVFWFVMTFVIVTSIVAVIIAVRSSEGEATKWARQLLTAYGAAALGYLVGRKK